MNKTINGIQKRIKPRFRRQGWNKIKSLSKRVRWRHPTGRHSKVRLHHRGHSRAIATGFGSDKRIRDLMINGLKPIRIHTVEELQKIDKQKEGALISKNVGQKNKLVIAKKAKELGIKVLNIAENYITKTEEQFKKRKEEKQETEKQKEEKKKELEKKAKETDKESKEQKTEEEKKKDEKELKEKILTKG